MGRRLWTVLAAVLFCGFLCGDVAVAIPAGRVDTAAAAAVRVLTAPVDSGSGSGELVVPGDFGEVMGYRPVLKGGVWVAPHGACSAPTGSTRYDFSGACSAHDLGYDLLRYSARVGQPLGPWAREAVDAAFGRALDARCAEVGGSVVCRAAAATYHAAVVVNSWRQDWQDPRPEPALPWVLLASALTVAPVVLNAMLGLVDRVSKRRESL